MALSVVYRYTGLQFATPHTQAAMTLPGVSDGGLTDGGLPDLSLESPKESAALIRLRREQAAQREHELLEPPVE